MNRGGWGGEEKIKDSSGGAPADGRNDDQSREGERERWRPKKKTFIVLGGISINGDEMRRQFNWTNMSNSVYAERPRGDWTLEMARRG